MNQITEIQSLEKLSKLNWLRLHDNKITKIKGLDGLTNLEYLDLSYNIIPKSQIDKFKTNHPKIKVFKKGMIDF